MVLSGQLDQCIQKSTAGDLRGCQLLTVPKLLVSSKDIVLPHPLDFFLTASVADKMSSQFIRTINGQRSIDECPRRMFQAYMISCLTVFELFCYIRIEASIIISLSPSG